MKTFTFICGPAALFTLAASGIHAQTGGGYAIIASAVSSGAGQSTGSGYTLTGISGQPDVDRTSSGGGYSLSGGFWPAVLVQLESSWQITMAREGAGFRLTWPAAARDEGYALQTSLTMQDRSWTDVPGTGGVTTYLQTGSVDRIRFYRLHKP